MKKITFILALIFGVLIFNSSKIYRSDSTSSKTRLDSIMSKRWRCERKALYDIMTFYKETVSSRANEYNGDVYTRHYAYYITDDILDLGFDMEARVKKFDQTKVGKSNNGKYLVTIFVDPKTKEQSSPCHIYEILELSDIQFVLQRVFHTGERAALPKLIYKAEPLD